MSGGRHGLRQRMRPGGHRLRAGLRGRRGRVHHGDGGDVYGRVQRRVRSRR